MFGSETIMLQIMLYLKAKGYIIHCITQKWSDNKFHNLLTEAEIPYTSLKLGFLYLSKPLWTLDTVLNYPKAVMMLRKIVKNFDPDIIYHNSYKNLVMMSPFLPREKIFYHVEDIHPLDKQTNWMFKVVNKRTNKVIASSRTVKENLLNLKLTMDIPVIYNGIEELYLSQSLAKESQFFGVGVIAQLIPRKGQIDVILAVEKLIKEGYDLKCFLFGAGDNDYINFLKNTAIEKNIKDYVFFMGYESNKYLIYQNLDVCIVPSRSEAFGISVVEPMFLKKAVIGTDVGGIKEIIQHGVNGLLYQPGEVNVLKEQIKSLIADASLRSSLTTNALKKAKEEFTIEKMVNSIEKEFKEMG